jgi:hypothetical protein
MQPKIAGRCAQARGHGRWFAWQQNAQPAVSYFVKDCLILFWFKIHSSHFQALLLQQQQPLDPVFSLCKEFMADSQFPRAYKIGKHSRARVPSRRGGIAHKF